MIRTFVVEQETALYGRGALRARQRPIHMQTRLQQHSLPRYNACILYTTIFPVELEKVKKKNSLYCHGTGSIPANLLTIYKKPYMPHKARKT
jgi:hypothetical protein